MTRQSDGLSGKVVELRERAEAALRGRSVAETGLADRNPDEIQTLLHNLEVYQIELEMQNHELRSAQDELASARDRYSNLFDFAPVGYFTLDGVGCIREANLTAAKLFGVDRAKLIGRPLGSYVANEAQDDWHRLRRQLRGESAAVSEDLVMQRANGEPFPAHLDGSSAGPYAGEVADETRFAMTDISERKLLEERRALFFSIASHELRTPVTNMNLALDLLTSGEWGQLSAEQATLIEKARAGGYRLQRLVREILNVQRLNSCEMDYQTSVVALGPLLIEAQEQFLPMASRKGIELTLEDDCEGVRVHVDSDRLLQVLSNLLSNALRYSPPEGLVRIAAATTGGWVRVSVTDNGAGVPKSFQEHVFEPFAQANPSLEDDAHRENFGLGLNIARRIIQRFGGRIGFTSRPGVATTFFFELPVRGRRP